MKLAGITHNCKPISTPLEFGKRFEKLSEEETAVDIQKYQMIIGCLTYAATATRPDIAASVGILSQFISKPGKQHWEGIKRILRYLKGTVDYGLLYSCHEGSAMLKGYSDADWAGDPNTRRSTPGYTFQIYGNLISWQSKRQATVAKLSSEAEYIALSIAGQEAIWLRRLITDLGIKLKEPTILFEDNQSAIELSKNPKYHNRTKQIDVSYHFIREQVTAKTLCINYCCTEEMLADVMTKGLPRPTFKKFRDKLGICRID